MKIIFRAIMNEKKEKGPISTSILMEAKRRL